MFNLVIKDLLVQKKYIPFSAAFGLMMLLLFGLQGGPLVPASYVFIPFAISYFFLINSCQAEEKNNSEIILNSLPISRKEIVMSKYLLSLLITLATLAFVSLAGGILISVGIAGMTLITYLESTLALVLSLFFLSLYLPLFFKFGHGKTQAFTMVVFLLLFFVPGQLISFVMRNPENYVVAAALSLLENNPYTMVGMGLLLALVFMLVSLYLSIGFYRNREF